MKKLLPFLILIAFCFSCKKPVAFQYRTIKDFHLDKFGLTQSQASMNFVFFNPNNYGVNLKKVDCDLYVDSAYAGKFLLDTTMHIPANAEFVLPASFDVEMKVILKNTLSVLTGSDVLINAKGTTRVGKGGIYINVPFEYEGRQKLNLF